MAAIDRDRNETSVFAISNVSDNRGGSRDRRTDGTVTSKPIGDRIHQYRLNTCVGRFSVVCL